MSLLSLAASAHRAQGGAGFACVFSFAMGPKKRLQKNQKVKGAQRQKRQKHKKEIEDWGRHDSNEKSWNRKRQPRHGSNEKSWNHKHQPKEEVEENEWGWGWGRDDSNEKSWNYKHRPKEEIEENDWGWGHQHSKEKSWNHKDSHWQDTCLKKEKDAKTGGRVASKDNAPNGYEDKGTCQKPLPTAKRLCPSCPMCQQAMKTKHNACKTEQGKDQKPANDEMIEVEVEEEDEPPKKEMLHDAMPKSKARGGNEMVHGALPKSKARGGNKHWQAFMVAHNPNRKVPRPILPVRPARRPRVIPPPPRQLSNVEKYMKFQNELGKLRSAAEALGMNLKVDAEPLNAPTTTSKLGGSGQGSDPSLGKYVAVGRLPRESSSVVSPSNASTPATSIPMTPAKTGVQQFVDVKTEHGATPGMKPPKEASTPMTLAKVGLQQSMDVKIESGAIHHVKPSRAVAHAQMTQANSSLQLFMDVKTECGAARRSKPSMPVPTRAPIAPAQTDVQQFEGCEEST